MNKSRIYLLLTGVLISALLITAGLILAQSAQDTNSLNSEKTYHKSMTNLAVKNNLQKYGIEVIQSTNPNFETELAKYIGENKNLAQLVNTAAPFAFFIRNNSGKEVVGISLRWQFTDNNEKKVEIPQTEANPGVLMGLKPMDPSLIGKTSLINNKDIKFVTYFNDLVGYKIAFANMRLKNPTVNYPNNSSFENISTDIASLTLQKEKTLNSYVIFSVSIDGIVFNDGTFIGEDQNLFFETLNGQLQARKEVNSLLMKAKLESENATNILDDLISKTSDLSVNFAAYRAGNMTKEQVFEFSYKSYLKNLARELNMKRTKMPDENIIQQFQSFQTNDFVNLHKVED